MFQHTQPAPLGDVGDGLDEFRVESTREIHALLRRLLDASSDVFLSAPNGAHVRTTLWTVDAGRGMLSFAAEAGDPQVQRLVGASEVVAVGYLDNVKVQFDLGPLLLVHGADACALQAGMPRQLFRFQRRQSFRVKLPARAGAAAVLRHPALPEMSLTLRILDVSIGGCALFVPANVPPLPPGTRVHGARLELDATTRFAATLMLHHVTSLDGDAAGTRVGCSLHDLDGDAQRALQRYIDQTQKRRRLLSLD